MARKNGNKVVAQPLVTGGVERRWLLRFGTLVTALTGASAVSAMTADRSQAAPGDKTSPNTYVPLAEKGSPSGVATLDANARIQPSQLPDLSGTYVSKWKANTAYLAGDEVLSPLGDVVSAKFDFTSNATYNSADWNQSAVLTEKLDRAEAVTTFLKISEAPLTPERFGALGDGSTNDTAAINAMFDALVPGGDIRLIANRRYMTDGGHTITTPSVKIVGSSGRAQTYNSSAQLYLRDGANSDMLTIANNQVTIRDLTLFGNYKNQTSASRGIVTPPTAGANYFLLDAVWVDSFNGDGYAFESMAGTLSSTILNCESRKNRGYGMRFTGTATDSMVSNCYIDQNWQSGISCSAGDLSLTGVHIWGNGNGNSSGDRDGITFQSSSGCRVINCYIETQYEGAGIRFRSGTNKGHIISECDIWANGFQGIYAFQASNCIIANNVIRSNNYKGQALAAGAGLLLDSCSAINTNGNQFFSTGANRQTYGYVELGVGNAGNLFLGNTSRAADHTTGNWVIATGTASPTLPATPASFNAG